MIQDPRFWRSGAISASTVMIAVLVIVSIDTLRAIRAGGRNVPEYTVINRRIGYRLDAATNQSHPVLGQEELLFGRRYSAREAAKLIERGKLVIQTRACLDCHTIFGIGAYYAPDLTKSWLDPIWPSWQAMTPGGSSVKPEELLFSSLFLGVFALAGGAYGSFFAVGKLIRSRLFLWIGWLFFALQTVVCLVLLRDSALHPGWKIFLVASWIGYAVIPPLAWSALERLHGKEERKP